MNFPQIGRLNKEHLIERCNFTELIKKVADTIPEFQQL